ncbi:hypothetical protein BC835DRAFT_165403 [Cytidiella melzeri]|nr:hypothetical protein BC835DRAFT_165403 [Cytidiella melzeri]
MLHQHFRAVKLPACCARRGNTSLASLGQPTEYHNIAVHSTSGHGDPGELGNRRILAHTGGVYSSANTRCFAEIGDGANRCRSPRHGLVRSANVHVESPLCSHTFIACLISFTQVFVSKEPCGHGLRLVRLLHCWRTQGPSKRSTAQRQMQLRAPSRIRSP